VSNDTATHMAVLQRQERDRLIEEMARAAAQKMGWMPWESLQESEAHGESVLGRKEFREGVIAAVLAAEARGYELRRR
jgi:hypothetical protein